MQWRQAKKGGPSPTSRWPARRPSHEEESLFLPGSSLSSNPSVSLSTPSGAFSLSNDTSPTSHVTSLDPSGSRQGRRASRKRKHRGTGSFQQIIYGKRRETNDTERPQFLLTDNAIAAKTKFDWPGALYLDLSSPTSPWYRRPSIVWFRDTSLRVEDNAALHAAVRRMAPLLLVFIHETDPDDDARREDELDPKAWTKAVSTDTSGHTRDRVTLPGVVAKRARTSAKGPATKWFVRPTSATSTRPSGKRVDFELLPGGGERENQASEHIRPKDGHKKAAKDANGKRLRSTVKHLGGDIESQDPHEATTLLKLWNLGATAAGSGVAPQSPEHHRRHRRKQAASQNGPASVRNWWLHHSLQALSEELAALGADLILRVARGTDVEELEAIVREVDADAVYYNRDPSRRQTGKERTVESMLRSAGISCYDFEGDVLVDPREFEPECDFESFAKKWSRRIDLSPPSAPLPSLKGPIRCFGNFALRSLLLDDLELVDENSSANDALEAYWGHRVGCDFARENVKGALSAKTPSKQELELQKLGPTLSSGEFSTRALFWDAKRFGASGGRTLRLLSAREFGNFREAIRMRAHRGTPAEALLEKALLEGRNSRKNALFFQRGITGFPVIDATIRQLRSLGWIHERYNVMLALFFCKYLLLPQEMGYHFVQSQLVDVYRFDIEAQWSLMQKDLFFSADLSNSVFALRSWSAVQRHPQTRQLLTQHVRRYLPELVGLPDEFVLCPWKAPREVMEGANLHLIPASEYDLVRGEVDVHKLFGKRGNAVDWAMYPRRVVAIRRRAVRYRQTHAVFNLLCVLNSIPRLLRGRAAEIIASLKAGMIKLTVIVKSGPKNGFVLKDEICTCTRSTPDSCNGRRLIGVQNRAQKRDEKSRSRSVQKARKRNKASIIPSTVGRESHSMSAATPDYSTSDSSGGEATSPHRPASIVLDSMKGPPRTLEERQRKLLEAAALVSDLRDVSSMSSSQTKRELFRVIAEYVMHAYELTNNVDRRTSRDSVRLCILKDQIRKWLKASSIPCPVRVTVNHIKEFFQVLNLQVTGEWDRRGHGGVRGPYVYGLRPQHNGGSAPR